MQIQRGFPKGKLVKQGLKKGAGRNPDGGDGGRLEEQRHNSMNDEQNSLQYGVVSLLNPAVGDE